MSICHERGVQPSWEGRHCQSRHPLPKPPLTFRDSRSELLEGRKKRLRGKKTGRVIPVRKQHGTFEESS